MKIRMIGTGTPVAIALGIIGLFTAGRRELLGEPGRWDEGAPQ
jgi:hypothetical protein